MITLRIKVKPEAYPWLAKAAIEVNQVWNWARATTVDAADRNRRANAKFLTGFELCNLSAGASAYFGHIGANVIQRVCREYASKRIARKKFALAWRVSSGVRRSLGWVPFTAKNLLRKERALRFYGKTIRVFEFERLQNVKWGDGCFAQDAVGDWWLCLPVAAQPKYQKAPRRAAGIDLGLKVTAVTSKGSRLKPGRYYRRLEEEIAETQRRGHQRQRKRLLRRASRRRRDAIHKFTRKIVNRYELIVVGDVSSLQLVKTRMAKSVLDTSWGMLRTQLLYKGEHAGRVVQVVDERYTSRTCSRCGAITGPSGRDMLDVRRWVCGECGASHDRDANAARNILTVGLRCRGESSGSTQVLGKEPPSAGTSHTRSRVRQARHFSRSETGSGAITRAT